MMNPRKIIYWFMGSISIVAGNIIAAGIVFDYGKWGVSGHSPDVWISLLVAIFLVGFGGLLWISTAILAMEDEEEEEIYNGAGE